MNGPEVVIFGPKLSKRIGGVSVFIDNLKTKQSEFNFIHVYWSDWWKYFYKKNWHINVSSNWHYCLGIFLAIAHKRIILYFHNDRIAKNQNLLIFIERLGARLIFVNDKQFLMHNALERSSHIPAYIRVDNILEQSLKLKREFNVIFSIWSFDKNTAERIYGTDLLYQLMEFFKKEAIAWYLFGGENIQDWKDDIESVISEDVHVVFYENMKLVNFLSDADLLLRLNREDGFGLVVQEALDNGCDAIASDCCKRSDNCILFESGNIEDLKRVFRSYLIGTKDVNKTWSIPDSTCKFQSINKVYKELYETVDTKTWFR